MKPRYLKFDAACEKKFAKYIDQLTEAKRRRLKKKLQIFKENIFDKRLKTHKLKGRLALIMPLQSTIQIELCSKYSMTEVSISLKSVAMTFATESHSETLIHRATPYGAILTTKWN